MPARPKPGPDDPNLWEQFGGYVGSMDPWLQRIILIGGAVAVLWGFLKWIRPGVSNARSDLRSIRDTLVGRPAMRDSITKEIIPGTARPSIGQRMDDMAESVKKLAETTTRLDDHEKRLSRVEDALQIDRRLDKIESVQLLRTIETVAQAEPPAESPEGERPD